MSLSVPYYDCDGITIYHADCRDILPHLPKVDLVLTDPPYGIDGGNGRMNVAVYKEQPKQLKELTTRYNESREYLANQLPTLTDGEIAQVLERYPDVTGM